MGSVVEKIVKFNRFFWAMLDCRSESSAKSESTKVVSASASQSSNSPVQSTPRATWVHEAPLTSENLSTATLSTSISSTPSKAFSL